MPSLGSQVSKGPKNRVFGPKYYNINSIWALKPYYLAPWSLRGCGVSSQLGLKPKEGLETKSESIHHAVDQGSLAPHQQVKLYTPRNYSAIRFLAIWYTLYLREVAVLKRIPRR